VLFNSYAFLFLFLPVTLIAFFWLRDRFGRVISMHWLVLASFFFYGWWNPAYLLLIALSILFNFGLGRWMTARMRAGRESRSLLVLGIAGNLLLLGYYKYAGFFIGTIDGLTGWGLTVPHIVLPLGISFFTFTQIAYLVDVREKDLGDYSLSHYALFVTFFPHLLAGPIIHHKEMMPQFEKPQADGARARNFAIGMTLLIIGLVKKTVLADGVAPYAGPVFAAAGQGHLTFLEAWGGALAYTMQLYFDFSGYTDMAYGTARFFGIVLPVNFFSPYKATSVVEFWRRWHITLSRFLRDYIYIPLGGNRKGLKRRYLNLMATMLLGGLWHGAGWTYVIWGGLHGLYLVVNHAWHWVCHAAGLTWLEGSRVWKGLAWLITFLAVVVGWVFFRAPDMKAALLMLKAMAGGNGIALPNAIMARLGAAGAALESIGIGTYLGGGGDFVMTWLWVGVLTVIALAAPNSIEIMRRYRPALSRFSVSERYAVSPLKILDRLIWRPSTGWSVACAVLAAMGILSLGRISQFLYFQF
jgi:D-alanyl-lipoteichoic acid acyltransferase DltB (MBOAT superfamily)